MRALLSVVALGAAAFTLGCSSGAKDPDSDPSQFPKALANLESLSHEIIAAFEGGDHHAADRPMHQLGKTFNTIKRLAPVSGLSDQQQTKLDDATSYLLDTFAKLHEPMHDDALPEDFDFESLHKDLEEGLAQLRSALPAALVKELDEAAANRATTAPAEEADHDHEDHADHDHADHDHGDEDHADHDAEHDHEGEEPAAETGAAMPPPARLRLVSTDVATRAPIGPSVIVEGAADLHLAPERVNRCVELTAAAPPGDRWVQFVPALHVRLRPDLTIDAYGFRDIDGAFAPATDDLADRFRDAFAAVIGQAVRRGMNVSLLPHLDAAGDLYEWRNLFRFAPDEVIGAGSYESLLLEPLADAVLSQATPGAQIDFAISGEMGRSLFERPRDYLPIVRRLKERFAADPRTAGVRVGVALNWSNVAGGADESTGGAHAIDPTALAELFDEFEFVGFSCYAPVGTPPSPDDFAKATSGFLNDLKRLGVDLPRDKRLVFSEVGIGGGPIQQGADGPVYSTLADAAAMPYEGAGPLGLSPWRDPQLATLRAQFHAALCEYLANRSDAAPAIDKAFLWSNTSWDPQGVTPRGQRDEAIAAMIDRHNAG